MSIDEDALEECDGCGNFMFQCTCEEDLEEKQKHATNSAHHNSYYVLNNTDTSTENYANKSI